MLCLPCHLGYMDIPETDPEYPDNSEALARAELHARLSEGAYWVPPACRD